MLFNSYTLLLVGISLAATVSATPVEHAQGGRWKRSPKQESAGGSIKEVLIPRERQWDHDAYKSEDYKTVWKGEVDFDLTLGLLAYPASLDKHIFITGKQDTNLFRIIAPIDGAHDTQILADFEKKVHEAELDKASIRGWIHAVDTRNAPKDNAMTKAKAKSLDAIQKTMRSLVDPTNTTIFYRQVPLVEDSALPKNYKAQIRITKTNEVYIDGKKMSS
jgi:hypothetical protein